ncbi:hypothetical protein BDV96DRAFT_561285 [Lophiotrema nucula]|uniref:Heterokaryon incompatibility domain-containing protein n=1 Tax=Lophiotrema nucula TaxID=690887 RepID=A0A6A5ZSQ1_9PLEO|nr:hypothetical protein BDV96DRAFT_561285 [Lophiotrema nucula]
MPSSDLQKEEDALGTWPRRLLHVKTLTSYEWQPGNFYGGYKEPAYNAISYTWGRYRLKEGIAPDVESLPLIGTDWLDQLPRIDPEHFTSAQLRDVIKVASTLSMRADSFGSLVTHQVEFIWLDIACIDQREGEPRSFAEIGRQALIFRGANTTLVWLNKTINSKVEHIWRSRDWWFQEPSEHTDETSQDAVASMNNFVSILKDPWFSSLWTLQEAYLRPDAIILSRTGKAIMSGAMVLTLAEILEWGRISDNFCTRRVHGTAEDPRLQEIRNIIQSKGLVALRARNKMALLNASMHRTASIPSDRVYGIQQVFGFRLGKTSINAQAGQEYTLDALEVQLAEEILTNEPILSQTHVFMHPVPVRDRWKMNACSMVPSSIKTLEPRDDPKFKRRCSFWVQKSGPEIEEVWWKGCTTPLEKLADPASWGIRVLSPLPDSDEDHEWWLDPRVKEDAWWPHYALEIYPDVTEELYDYAKFENPPSYDIIPRGEACFDFAEWLVRKYSPATTQVLLMGSILEEGRRQGLGIGLVLVEQQDNFWMRVGVCQWWVPQDIGTLKQFLEGKGADWEDREGIFGYVQSSATFI